MSRFSQKKHDEFEAELHALVQKYLDMTDVDALSISIPLDRKAKACAFIGYDERQKFREQQKQQS